MSRISPLIEQGRRWINRPLGRGSAFVVFGTGLLLTLTAWRGEQFDARQEQQVILDRRVAELASCIERAAHAPLPLLQAAGAMIVAQPNASGEAWRRYFDAVDIEHVAAPLRTVGFAPLLARDPHRPGREAVSRRPTPENGEPVPGEQRGYAGIRHVVSFDGADPEPLGFDLLAEQPHREMLERARDSGDAVLGPAIATGGTAAPARRMLVVPVFLGESDTVEARRATLVGWVFGRLAIDRLVLDALRASDGGMPLQLFEEPWPFGEPELLFAIGSPPALPSVREAVLPLHGTLWRLRAAVPSGALPTAARDSRLALAIGLVISAALFVLFWRLAAAGDRATARAGDLGEGLRAGDPSPPARADPAGRPSDDASSQLPACAQSGSAARAAATAEDGLMATLSHDLRTPLNAILGWTHIFERDGVNAETVRRGARVIRRNVLAQVRMIDDRLDAARRTSGGVCRGRRAHDGETERLHGGTGARARRLDGLRLMLVEDHADTRDALATMLELEGASTIAATTVAEAIARTEALLPGSPLSAILCDIDLPDGDGYRFLELLRGLEAARGVGPIPVLAVTAYAQPRHRQRALSAGFVAHVPKPVDLPGLIAQLARFGRR